MDFNKFSIYELKRFRSTLGYDTISCLLVDEIDELIEYKKIPNVFKIYTNSEPFIKVDESLSYVASYCVKNLLGLKRLSKYLNVYVEGKKRNYPIIVDVFKDSDNTLKAKSLDKAWNIFSSNKNDFLKDMFEKRYIRDINIELPTGELISEAVGLDIVTFIRNTDTNKDMLICKRTINDFDYYYSIYDNKISCFDKSKLNMESGIVRYIGEIVLRNLERCDNSEELVIKKFMLKNVNYNTYYRKRLKIFIENMKGFKNGL